MKNPPRCTGRIYRANSALAIQMQRAPLSEHLTRAQLTSSWKEQEGIRRLKIRKWFRGRRERHVRLIGDFETLIKSVVVNFR